MMLRALKDIPTSVNPISKGDRFIEENDERARDWIAQGYAEQLLDAPKKAPPPPLPAAVAAALALGGTALATSGVALSGSSAELSATVAKEMLPAWADCTVAIIGSGPSLSEKQCEKIAVWHENNSFARVVAINTSFRRAPFADMLYACDGAWWRAEDPETHVSYYTEASRLFAPEALWTQDETAAKDFGLQFIRSKKTSVLSLDKHLIAQGANSGIQAMNLAFHAGARKFILLGIDCRADIRTGNQHWHPDHPSPLSNSAPHRMWQENFTTFAKGLREHGVEVVNCSPETALNAFRKGDLEAELAK